MVKSLRNLSIHTKLVIFAVTGLVIALALSSGALLQQNITQIRRAKQDEVQALTRVLGSNVNAAIEFNDADTASELLSSLRQLNSVEFAVVYDMDDTVFATYPRELEDLPAASGSGVVQTDQYLEVRRTITSFESSDNSGERIGTLLIRTNQREIKQRISEHIWLTALILVASLTVSVLMSMVFQRSITRPIAELVDAAEHVSNTQEFDRRAKKFGNDEHGKLCDAFNAMLDRIESDQQSLEQARDELETRVQQRTSELRDAVNEARNANRAKSDFLANMSHEIRTPMTSVLGFADLLATADLDQQTMGEFLTAIRRNGQHLLAIINDILDVTKIEAGRVQVERIACSPHDLVQESIALLQPRATEKQINLTLEYKNAVPMTIETDPTRLRQILGNLIANAIKFTSKGSVRVTVFFDDANEKLLFEIADTGCGIAPENLAKIFQPFTQSDETMTRRFGGTGLGLTISKQLATLLGGDIRFESELDKGTTCTLDIEAGDVTDVPRYQEMSNHVVLQPEANTIENETPLEGLRLLLVEDGVDNQRFIKFVLKRGGAEVDVAENGLIGMETAIDAWRRGSPYDVILMDLQMPQMDGYTATRLLRDEGYPQPIIALTAHAMSHEHNTCIQVGCDGYATKPIVIDKLFENNSHGSRHCCSMIVAAPYQRAANL